MFIGSALSVKLNRLHCVILKVFQTHTRHLPNTIDTASRYSRYLLCINRADGGWVGGLQTHNNDTASVRVFQNSRKVEYHIGPECGNMLFFE